MGDNKALQIRTPIQVFQIINLALLVISNVLVLWTWYDIITSDGADLCNECGFDVFSL